MKPSWTYFCGKVSLRKTMFRLPLSTLALSGVNSAGLRPSESFPMALLTCQRSRSRVGAVEVVGQLRVERPLAGIGLIGQRQVGVGLVPATCPAVRHGSRYRPVAGRQPTICPPGTQTPAWRSAREANGRSYTSTSAMSPRKFSELPTTLRPTAYGPIGTS